MIRNPQRNYKKTFEEISELILRGTFTETFKKCLREPCVFDSWINTRLRTWRNNNECNEEILDVFFGEIS